MYELIRSSLAAESLVIAYEEVESDKEDEVNDGKLFICCSLCFWFCSWIETPSTHLVPVSFHLLVFANLN